MATAVDAKPLAVVQVSDDVVTSKGRRTGWALVGLSVLMGAFCLSLMATFAAELANVVGDGGCPLYKDGDLLKENYCKCAVTAGGGGGGGGGSGVPSVGDCNNAQAVEYTADTWTWSSCPNACSDACAAVGQGSATEAVDNWKTLLRRFDACRANAAKARECLPIQDTDGNLANYRGPKYAHPSLSLAATSAFIQRSAFLDACDAQASYADRRDTAGPGVLACICVALVVWILTTLYTLRKPNYAKYPRETEMKPLTKFGEKKGFNNRYHPDSIWLYFTSATALFGFFLQLYSFYTPTTTDVRIPILQGTWIGIEVISRGVLMLLEKFTLLEASSIFFDIGFAAIGFSALMEPFFEAKIVNTLPEFDDSITNYSLAIRVLSFVWPLISSAMKVKDLYVDNYWPAPATAIAMTERKRSIKRIIIKLVLLALQLGAAVSVYAIMGHKDLCHQFRTCARTTCEPNVPVGVPLDVDLIGSNGGSLSYRQELISEDGTKKWRWQANTVTKLKFTKSGGKLYADFEISAQGGNLGENKISEPGQSAQADVQANTPSTACGTRFEVQCQEVNPRHAMEELTGKYEWVKYNTSMYKFVAKHDYGATSGSPTCFGSSSQWWTNNAMFVAGPDLRVGGTTSSPDLGFIFMEQTCEYTQGQQSSSRTKYCLSEPPFVAVYAPYGRASVTGTYTLQNFQGTFSGLNVNGVPSTWATATHTFDIIMNENDIVAAGGSSSSSGGGGGSGGGCNQAPCACATGANPVCNCPPCPTGCTCTNAPPQYCTVQGVSGTTQPGQTCPAPAPSG